MTSVMIVGSGFTGFECGRLKVRADLQISPPTAQHAIRQGKVLGNNVAASLGYGEAKEYRHSDMGLVVDLGPHYAVGLAHLTDVFFDRSVVSVGLS